MIKSILLSFGGLFISFQVMADDWKPRAMTEAERRVRESVLKELKEKAADCGVTEWKRAANDIWGKALKVDEEGDPLIQKFIKAQVNLPQLIADLKSEGVTLEFGVEKGLQDSCHFSDEALKYNFGSVEALAYLTRLQEMVKFSKKAKYKVNLIRIEITRDSSDALFARNRKLEVKDETRYEKQKDGTEVRHDFKMSTIVVNAGDYETGLILFPMAESLVDYKAAEQKDQKPSAQEK